MGLFKKPPSRQGTGGERAADTPPARPTQTPEQGIAAAKARTQKIGTDLGVAHLKHDPNRTADAADIVARQQLKDIAQKGST